MSTVKLDKKLFKIRKADYMTLLDTIKKLADARHITIAELERSTGISNGQIRRWDKSSPKAENLSKVADYFNVSTDYLLGREDSNENPSIDDIVDNLRSYQGKPIPDDEKDVLKDIIKGYLDRR